MTISLFATINPMPEHRDAVEQALREMVERSRAEPGNLRYDLFVGEGETLAFHLFELYIDEAAVEAHRQSEHYQAYRTATLDWLAAPTEVRLARPLDVAPFN
ncbi:antibiotic biosynthesis monooxygenase [Metapseudomonas lalkuanensis]|uniref:Antibiotic biosynthesis monooxygenase n=1 Tax=Metapseudomonas lalkuanensis TaxID=2604832 RepID=A0A5J6QN11_9GAMM|nr:putative quinol monooxygenase [Pseudomonas lalkuanensis]QEY61989.1 antibiotic biosynthesis monooxygenase [Pseudomonas lalkuanensis]UCO99770.1 antibiotic biosynthesis monooxygenase [Pseudomonas lalkuanensis]